MLLGSVNINVNVDVKFYKPDLLRFLNVLLRRHCHENKLTNYSRMMMFIGEKLTNKLVVLLSNMKVKFKTIIQTNTTLHKS